ncbi:unnamed protein product [Cladocopium goreaui]|uniref:Uncharacterized protein n=1 Tax=Cladocopium goreaui TaxID=2562237 RepID=A0A9P1C7Y5_9DINO|nr:unnamed protein product [Cladocopium goreaui]
MPGLASSLAKHKVVPGRNDGNIVSDFKSWVDSNGHKTYWFVSVHPGGLAVAKGWQDWMTLDAFVDQIQGNMNLPPEKFEEVVVELQYYVEFGVWPKPAITLKNEEQVVLHINFLSLLAGVFQKGGAFTDFLLKFRNARPSSLEEPWQAVVYCDEFHPGNVLNSTSRKLWCIYISFLEFKQMLSKENMWFCLATCRSTEVSQLAAGISQVFKLVMEHMFCHNSPDTGILLSSAKGSLRLFSTLGMVLQDGQAQKLVWCNRQDSGSKPCMMCNNIFQLKDAESADMNDCQKVFSRFTKLSQLHLATDADILQSWHRLKDKKDTVPAGVFSKWQQAAGVTFSPHCFMASEALQGLNLIKPVSMYCFDFMHGMCSHGLMQDTIFLVLESLNKNGHKVWDTLHDWVGLWVLPHGYSCNLKSFFGTKSVNSYRKAGTFKASASEMLCIYKLLQFFLQTMFLCNNVMVEQCMCFLCWADVLDFLVSIPAFLDPPRDQLARLVETALEATVAAGFADDMKAKHHWTLHYSVCLERWKQLPTCWAMERKHKTPRKFGSAQCNLATYEIGIMSAVTSEHISILLQDEDLYKTGCYLVEAHRCSKNLEGLLKQCNLWVEGMASSSSCRLQCGMICKAGDVAFLRGTLSNTPSFKWGCCQVKHFLQAGNLKLCVVDMFNFLEARANTFASSWQGTTGSLKLISAENILQPVLCTFGKSGKLTCLTPAPLACCS